MRHANPLRLISLPLGLATVLLLACQAAPPSAPARPGTPASSPTAANPESPANPDSPAAVAAATPSPAAAFTPAQLQEAVRNFADQYRDNLADVTNRIIRETDDPQLRLRAHLIKLDAATAMYDIAADPIPANAMVNAVVLVTLQTEVLKRQGPRLFPDHHALLLQRGELLQTEAFAIAARLMSAEQRTRLLTLCRQWADANPDQNDVAYVRLDDLPGVGGTSVTATLSNITSLPAQFMGKFIPFGQAGVAVSDASTLAERMSWLAPRLLILAHWRAEAIIYQTLSAPEVVSALAVADRFTAIAESLPDVLNQQRNALFTSLEQNENTLRALLTDAQRLTEQTSTLVNSTHATIESTTQLAQQLDPLLARIQSLQSQTDPNEPPSRPFDITEYNQALQTLQQALAQANNLATTLDDTTSPNALNNRLDALESRITRLIFIAAAAFLLVAILSLLAWRLLTPRSPK